MYIYIHVRVYVYMRCKIRYIIMIIAKSDYERFSRVNVQLRVPLFSKAPPVGENNRWYCGAGINGSSSIGRLSSVSLARLCADENEANHHLLGRLVTLRLPLCMIIIIIRLKNKILNYFWRMKAKESRHVPSTLKPLERRVVHLLLSALCPPSPLKNRKERKKSSINMDKLPAGEIRNQIEL